MSLGLLVRLKGCIWVSGRIFFLIRVAVCLANRKEEKKKKKKCWFWVSFFFASLCVEVLLFHCSVVMHMRLIAFLVDYLQVKSPARR